ncbi:hypothetical protein Amsp01_059380 [Amycolatopsis sp. NBRC 101858]|uniref:hypothetical protein n=1 Tax=Amycolatopsis sp. NBRC 101858 TaxID=3032200 RepID=UPI00249FA577|nr:hypothetical protein [Amycolatopsis sp. NBRC 101858]GLY39915.1 hypothetical protein Amsp01_059380 [Amycolatopsis sp. NBRC 101858]
MFENKDLGKFANRASLVGQWRLVNDKEGEFFFDLNEDCSFSGAWLSAPKRYALFRALLPRTAGLWFIENEGDKILFKLQFGRAENGVSNVLDKVYTQMMSIVGSSYTGVVTGMGRNTVTIYWPHNKSTDIWTRVE